MKHYIIIFLFLTSTHFCFANNLDSLKNQLTQKNISDKEKAELCGQIAFRLYKIDNEEATRYSRLGVQYALESKDDSTLSHAYTVLGISYERTGKTDSSFAVLDRSLSLAKKSGCDICLYSAYATYANTYRRKANYDKCLEYSLLALKQAEKMNNNEILCRALNGMGVIYITLGDAERAEDYYLQAADMAATIKDTSMISTIYDNIGIINRDLGNYDKSLKYYFKALSLGIAKNDSSSIAFLHNDIGAAYSKKGDVANGEKYLKQSIDFRERTSELNELAYTYNYLGENYERKKDLSQAAFFIKKALATAKKIGNNKQTYEAYESLSDFYARNNIYDSAYRYALLFKNFRDSIRQIDNENHIAQLTTQYETEKKEQKILEQQLEIDKRNYLLIGSAIVLLLGTLLVWSGYKRYKLKQETQLQQEVIHQQELATKAVLHAEENERRRIAADLHDGIGQMMSAAKMNLNVAMNDLNNIQPSQRSALEKSINLIDDSCKEIRTVSHNLMPNALLKSGLGNAIKNFINKIDSNVIKINLYTDGLDTIINTDVEMILYRVIQECVNNVIKHANASRLDISIIRDVDGISITLEDNGIGFNTNQLQDKTGIGIKNIQSRIAYLKGTIEWDSAPGKGTVISIHIG